MPRPPRFWPITKQAPAAAAGGPTRRSSVDPPASGMEAWGFLFVEAGYSIACKLSVFVYVRLVKLSRMMLYF